MNPPSGTMRHDDTLASLRARLQAFIARRVENRQVAEDLTHEILLRFLVSVRADQQIGNPTAWLYQAARNAVIDHYRTRRRQVRLDSVTSPPDALVEDPFTGDPRQTERELASCMRSLVDQLPEPYRFAVAATDLDGWTQAELAHATGLSISGAKSRVQRGRRQLRQLLTDCCTVQTSRDGSIVDYQPSRRCQHDHEVHTIGRTDPPCRCLAGDT